MSPLTQANIPTGSKRRRLERRFETLEAFQEEYRRNIANGGMFIPTHAVFEPRQVVDVELLLEFSDESIVLPAEVVNQVSPRLCGEGAASGVAVQFLESATDLRKRLGGVVGLPAQKSSAPSEERPVRDRDGDRGPARLSAQIQTEHASIGGTTLNLSRSGALLEIDDTPLPVGTSLRLTLTHPTRDEQLELPGQVVRRDTGLGGGSVLGIGFDPAASEADAAARFIADVQAADHARRAAVIGGPIEMLGVPNLLQTFSSCAERGTLTLTRPGERGTMAFEGGTLRGARLGATRGLKALSRLFAWQNGSFEFSTQLDEGSEEHEPVSIYGAVMEAATQLDELQRLDTSALPLETLLEIDPERLAQHEQDLSKVERGVIDLVSSENCCVGAILDRLDDFDAAIYRALGSLLDAGVVRVSG